MVLKVYLSTCSGNKEIKRKQDFVTALLTSRKIPFQEIDITDGSREDDKKFMRENAKPSGNNPLPLPPQIFDDSTYLGDYESFHEANENDELFEFLRISAPQPIVKPAVSSSYQWDVKDGSKVEQEVEAHHDTAHTLPEGENNHHHGDSHDTPGDHSQHEASQEHPAEEQEQEED